jgi:hypothetical protein
MAKGKVVYFTEEQLNLGIQGFYNIYIDLCDRDYGGNLDAEEEKKMEACERAIIKLGGRV